MTRQDIEDKIALLPKGGITIKRVKGSNGSYYEYHFLQWTENGKQKSRRLKTEELDNIKEQIEERKKLERMLASYDDLTEAGTPGFRTEVRIGSYLLSSVAHVKDLKKRSGYRYISDYVYGNEFNKVFILYGLRRTGKTTLIEQVIAEMKYEDLMRAAFIQITRKDSISDLNADLKLLEKRGYRYIFIDEVTFLTDFIEGAALLSDIYAAAGMKIVLSGTDSLGFWITKSNELYDRCRLLHTTFIPYREFASVLGIDGIDNYIQYGGTMSMSGVHYNEWAFADKRSTDEYVDSAIAQNIQHSLKYYQYEGHFRHLYSLYEKNELTGAINRVIEDINHRFTIDVLEREFRSNDLRISANNLRKDRSAPTTILDDIDVAGFTERLKDLLEIKNREECSVNIDETHVYQIKEYLSALDLIEEVNVVDNDASGRGRQHIVFTQPGLRYSQAKSFIESLRPDPLFKELSAEEQKYIIMRIMNEIKGRMAEDVVLLETKLAKPQMNVFKLQFSDGEFDMVIADPDKLEAELYEVKYSKEPVIEQARHLMDEKKCGAAEFRYGRITKKTVLYRGNDTEIGGIRYQNIESYLMGL
ncbi:MAG: AAA family ATPase [Clostridia bacterium]|nr:AAA family ATPase [Clostridia bacterium]